MRPFEEYAASHGNDKSFVLAGCGKLELWTRDPEIVAEVLRRPRDFMQVEITDLFMAKFGHNVLTSNGERWTRQRKIVASVINERISKAVFNESIKQTEGLLNEVFQRSEADTADTNRIFDMIKRITIHVLSGAGMGASQPWQNDENEKPKPGFKMTYIDSVKTVINNVTGPVILPQWFLSGYPSFLPGYQTLKALSYAVTEFPTHTKAMLERERKRQRTEEGAGSRNNIMSQLLQASEQESGKADNKDAASGALTEEELMGNLFVFTAAGFDTTANTLSYALVLLARYPQWQDWLLEEIDNILPENTASSEELEYQEIYPKCTRLMALLLEVLRLYTPLIHISKQARQAQTIVTSRGEYWLPADTTVYLNTVALHLDPAVWRGLNRTEMDEDLAPLGPNHGGDGEQNDEDLFRPTRWLNPPNSPGTSGTLFQPPKGAYVPWSAGPRVCPGMKMAQVEFTAVMLTLLRKHRICAPAQSCLPESDGYEKTQGSGRLEARECVERRLNEKLKDGISILTLQMKDVYDVGEDGSKGLVLRLAKR